MNTGVCFSGWSWGAEPEVRSRWDRGKPGRGRQPSPVLTRAGSSGRLGSPLHHLFIKTQPWKPLELLGRRGHWGVVCSSAGGGLGCHTRRCGEKGSSPPTHSHAPQSTHTLPCPTALPHTPSPQPSPSLWLCAESATDSLVQGEFLSITCNNRCDGKRGKQRLKSMSIWKQTLLKMTHF